MAKKHKHALRKINDFRQDITLSLTVKTPTSTNNSLRNDWSTSKRV